MVEALTIVVNSRGHEALVAFSGEEALDLVKMERPDVVLLDLTMPGIDGFETLDRLRELPQGRELPVLIITAHDEEDLERRVAELGGNGLLRKPVDVNHLAEQIAMHAAEAPTQA
jgi:CheY-like chemotaxis protein